MKLEDLVLKAVTCTCVLSGRMNSILTFISLFTDISNVINSPKEFVGKIMKTTL